MSDIQIYRGHDVFIIASIAFEANRQYCHSIGDFTHLPWDETIESIQLSTVAGVKGLIDNPNLTAEQSHEKWIEYKTAEGWTWGEVKDVEKKIHPCYCDYKQLPLEQQRKDKLFKAVVMAMIEE